MQTESTTAKSAVLKHLPWLISAAAFVFYLFTLHRVITAPGLVSLPQVTGWEWQPMFHAPLHFLVTYPIRWLPGGWQTIALNLFTAICGSLTLGLLARSVMLLPHDRTRDQRQLERSDYSFLSIPTAWLPPLFAVLVCGLQFSFWQHSIVATAEAFDLFLFAYLLRCLLESRVDPRESWLVRGAFIYGLAITNNFAMIGFLPVFVVALIWIKGYRFFDSGLIIQVILWGLAGLSFYFLLPIVNSLAGYTAQGFWEMVRMNIGAQKEALFGFPRYILLLISLTSLIPVLFMGIRWPAQFGDISAAGNALTNLMTHVIHAVFLVACLYVAFDPPFSPRRLYPYPLLPFYFLGALSIGYFSGYFLLVFGPSPAVTGWQRPSPLRRTLGYVVVALIWVGALAVPVGLFIQNRPEIVKYRSEDLYQYGLSSAESLPPGGGVVLSDDAVRLYAVAAALASQGKRDEWILVQTSSLSQPGYHRYLSRQFPQRWPSFLASRPNDQLIEVTAIIELIRKVSETQGLYYLHPSFGYFLEYFHMRPRNLVYLLQPYPTNQVEGPPLAAQEIESNDTFWKTFYQQKLSRMASRLAEDDPRNPDFFSSGLGAIYSRQLNAFGVDLQVAGALERAADYFKQALELNPRNPSAFINEEFNKLLQAGQRDNPEPSQGVMDRLQAYQGNWAGILRDNGPVDEPNSCFLLSTVFSRGRNFRQAALQLLRVTKLQPGNLPAKIALGPSLSKAGFPEKALELVAGIRQQFNEQQLDLTDQIKLLQIEARAYANLGQWQKGEQLLVDAQQRHPQDGRPFTALAEIYVDAGRLTNAMAVLEKQLTLQPKNISAMINYSALKIQNREYSQAAAILTPILTDDPKNMPALQNRAIAYFLVGQLDSAEKDYQALLALSSTPAYSIYYGLGEIAFKKGNKQLAQKHYQSYLDAAPPGDTPEKRFIQQRLKAL